MYTLRTRPRKHDETLAQLLSQFNENERILNDMMKTQNKRRREILDITSKIKRTRNAIGEKDIISKDLKYRILLNSNRSEAYKESIMDALRDMETDGGTLLSHDDGVKILIQQMETLHRIEANSRADRFERLRKEGMDEIKTIKIFLGGLEFKDYASFRVSAECTFDQLLSDACLYFSKSKERCMWFFFLIYILTQHTHTHTHTFTTQVHFETNATNFGPDRLVFKIIY